MSDQAPCVRLTEAQKRALMWLPADGSWTYAGGITSPVTMAELCHSGHVDYRPKGDRYEFRLTAAGIAARKGGGGEPQVQPPCDVEAP